jgi:hypothetical protein
MVLLRCRDPDAREERSRVFHGDVQIGSIGIRASVPVSANQPGLVGDWLQVADSIPGLVRAALRR